MSSWKSELGKQRDTLSVIAEILETAKQGVSKTHIQVKASLCTRQVNEYIAFMMETGLLKQSFQGDRKVYEATEKGSHLLKRAYELEDLLGTDKSAEKEVTRPPLELLRIAH